MANGTWLNLQQLLATFFSGARLNLPLRFLQLDRKNGVDGSRLCTIIFLSLRLYATAAHRITYP